MSVKISVMVIKHNADGPHRLNSEKYQNYYCSDSPSHKNDNDPHIGQGPGLLIPDPAKEKDCKAYEKTYWQVESHEDHMYAQRCKNQHLSFLDTQVSLAPTHVSWLVSWLVGPLVTLSDFQSLVSNGRSNQKN